MMVEEQLAGSWDQPTRTVVMHSAQPGRLQQLASELSDKASALGELNERALQLRTGGPREEDEGAGGQYGDPGQRVSDVPPLLWCITRAAGTACKRQGFVGS